MEQSKATPQVQAELQQVEEVAIRAKPEFGISGPQPSTLTVLRRPGAGLLLP